MGIQCAFCHSTVDNSFAPGIGKRLDGWANRDLKVGAIVALAPNLKPFTDLLGVDVETVKKVLASWGPGRYDAELDKDGKAFRPDGKQAGTLIQPAFGLAGVNLSTWTGFGSVTYWNAYVAGTQMHGAATFFDARFNNKDQYPVSAKSGSGNTRNTPDKATAKLAALHFYQLSIPAPKAPAGSYDKAAFERGKTVFNGSAKCATRHVPPLYTEPGTICMRPVRSASKRFRPTARRPTCTARHPWRVSGHTRRAAFSTTDGLRHYRMWWTTMTHSSTLNVNSAQKSDLVEYLNGIRDEAADSEFIPSLVRSCDLITAAPAVGPSIAL